VSAVLLKRSHTATDVLDPKTIFFMITASLQKLRLLSAQKMSNLNTPCAIVSVSGASLLWPVSPRMSYGVLVAGDRDPSSLGSVGRARFHIVAIAPATAARTLLASAQIIIVFHVRHCSDVDADRTNSRHLPPDTLLPHENHRRGHLPPYLSL